MAQHLRKRKCSSSKDVGIDGLNAYQLGLHSRLNRSYSIFWHLHYSIQWALSDSILAPRRGISPRVLLCLLPRRPRERSLTTGSCMPSVRHEVQLSHLCGANIVIENIYCAPLTMSNLHNPLQSNNNGERSTADIVSVYTGLWIHPPSPT